MSRQLVFSSMISVMVLATFALSSTGKAYAAERASSGAAARVTAAVQSPPR